MKERNKKYVLFLFLIVTIVFVGMFIFATGRTSIIQIVKPAHYKLASTPYTTLIYIGNGTAKVGGIEGIEYLETEYGDNLISSTDIYFPYSNITIDNKTFAVLNESISFNSKLQEIKQNIPLSSYASNNGTLYYIRLINFSNYYGIIIPANFMNKSYISLPFTITPYPSCPIIPAVSNAHTLVFNKIFSGINFNNFMISSIYAYTGIIVFKNTTGIVGNKQYPACVTINEQMPSFGVSVCSVNDVALNCTYFNNYGKWVNENPVYPQIKLNQTSVYNKNRTITGIFLP